MKSLRCCQCRVLLDEALCVPCYQALVEAKNAVVREVRDYLAEISRLRAEIARLRPNTGGEVENRERA